MPVNPSSDLLVGGSLPFSFNQLDQVHAGLGAHRNMLLPLAKADFWFHHFEFDEDTLPDFWASTETNSGTAFDADAASFGLKGLTDANDNDGLELHGKLAMWTGDRECGMAIRFKINTASNYQIESGFVDALTTGTSPACTNIDTPASGNGAGDVACLHIDTDATQNKFCLFTDGSTSGYNATATELGEPSGGADDLAIVSDTFRTVVIQTKGDAAWGFLFDEAGVLLGSAHHGYATANKIEGGTRLFPYFILRTRTTAALTAVIDYAEVWQHRRVLS